MKLLMKSFFTLALIVFAGTSAAQEQRTTKGVVVGKNAANQTITVRDDSSGQRNTYFVGGSTELKSTAQGDISFDQVKRGQAVELKFRASDAGRDIDNFTTDDIDNIVEIIPVAFEDVYTVTGKITGTRPAQSAFTFRPQDGSNRRTVNVPDGVTINRNGKDVGVEDLLVGDTATIRYRETDYGLVFVRSNETVEDAVADDRVVMDSDTDQDNTETMADTLPSTASNHWAWLIASLAFLMAAGGLRIARRHGAS